MLVPFSKQNQIGVKDTAVWRYVLVRSRSLSLHGYRYTLIPTLPHIHSLNQHQFPIVIIDRWAANGNNALIGI